MLNKIYNYFRIIHNIYIKNRLFLKKKTYALENEDLKVLEFFKNRKKIGLYVDVGCYHPTQINNTYLLYKKNWRGINIDTSKFSIDLFNFLRPDDFNFHCAISNKNKKINLYYQKDFSQLSSTDKLTAKYFIKGNLKKKKVDAFKLDTILAKTKYKNKQIDFLDIDVEGADLKVLQGLNFTKYSPILICIEIHHKTVKKSNVYKFLIKKKYRLVWSGKFSHIFVSKQIKSNQGFHLEA